MRMYFSNKEKVKILLQLPSYLLNTYLKKRLKIFSNDIYHNFINGIHINIREIHFICEKLTNKTRTIKH